MQNNYSNNNYAGFWVRLAAYVIDSIIVAAALLIVRLFMAGVMALLSGTLLGGNVLFHYTLRDIVLYVFKVMYFILATYCTGTTIGKRLMNLRVVPADREEKLSFIDVLYRETVGRFLCNISICIGYILVGIDKEKRGIHDMLCDTRVVYEKKVKVYPVYKRPPMQSVPPVPPMQQVPPQPAQGSAPPQNIYVPIQKPEPPSYGESGPRFPEGGYRIVDAKSDVMSMSEITEIGSDNEKVTEEKHGFDMESQETVRSVETKEDKD